jgi:hypothetical protein
MSFAARVIGALRLDGATYEEIEADPRALWQAAAVVGGFGLAAGIGLAGGTSTLRSAVTLTIAVVAGWLSWAVIVYHVGGRLLAEPQTRTDGAEVARTIGFSAAPGLLLALLAVPVARPVTSLVVAAWMLAAMVVAVRHALDFTHLSRAIAVCLVGWLVVAILAIATGFAFGPVVS